MTKWMKDPNLGSACKLSWTTIETKSSSMKNLKNKKTKMKLELGFKFEKDTTINSSYYNHHQTLLGAKNNLVRT